MNGSRTRLRKMSDVSWVIWFTTAATVQLAVLDLVLGLITPDYDIVRDTSSQLMSPDARYEGLARVSLGLHAALLLPFMMTTGRLLSTGQLRSGLITTAISVYIVAALISAIAANDSNAQAIGDLTANQVHDLAAIVMFAAAFATLIGTLFTIRTLSWSGQIATYASFTVLIIAGPVFLAEIVTEINGILERVLASAFLIWMVAIAWSAKNRNRLGDLE